MKQSTTDKEQSLPAEREPPQASKPELDLEAVALGVVVAVVAKQPGRKRISSSRRRP
jgi:hypothetical protein